MIGKAILGYKRYRTLMVRYAELAERIMEGRKRAKPLIKDCYQLKEKPLDPLEQ